jgi:hypothetical protein
MPLHCELLSKHVAIIEFPIINFPMTDDITMRSYEAIMTETQRHLGIA